jgi:hypothetical protein
MQHIWPGKVLRQTVTFRDPNGNVVDPSTVTLYVVPTVGTSATYVYGSGTEIAKVSTGVYRASVDTSAMAEGVSLEWDGAGVDTVVTTYFLDSRPSDTLNTRRAFSRV